MKIISSSPDKTIEIGRKLGQILTTGSIVCLGGDLGAGKTHFAKGVALGMGVEEHVTSPTFTIINEYEGEMPLYHVDAYRLEGEDEAYDLGLEEYLYGTGVTLIEWPERVKYLLPDEYLKVSISSTPGNGEIRELEFMASGAGYHKIIEELKASVCPGN